eukprot:TRINITY_DN20_c0_g1_i2.p1 TRINITY_DN20_c0_g1~~TRINITY_DN20_c0_g1_i2.p1  ORF type:complete len:170 (-),score=10.23 TRINITY_DN20_c0_g1_i2:92-601(-)
MVLSHSKLHRYLTGFAIGQIGFTIYYWLDSTILGLIFTIFTSIGLIGLCCSVPYFCLAYSLTALGIGLWKAITAYVETHQSDVPVFSVAMDVFVCAYEFIVFLLALWVYGSDPDRYIDTLNEESSSKPEQAPLANLKPTSASNNTQQLKAPLIPTNQKRPISYGSSMSV